MRLGTPTLSWKLADGCARRRGVIIRGGYSRRSTAVVCGLFESQCDHGRGQQLARCRPGQTALRRAHSLVDGNWRQTTSAVVGQQWIVPVERSTANKRT